jgi:type IV secretion system protein VirB9
MVQAQPLPEPPKPVEVVEVPKVLPMPAQMKPLPEGGETKASPEPADEKLRVSRANAEARIAPTREGYVNAIQVWPFTDGALYQVYAAPGRVPQVVVGARRVSESGGQGSGKPQVAAGASKHH